MPKRKSSKKRKQKNKLPLRLIIFWIVFTLIIAGAWAYFHPYEASRYVENLIEQIYGKPVRSTTVSATVPVQTIDGDGSDNLALGIPGEADIIIDREGYALGYIELHEQPSWVVYRMTAVEATTKAAQRDDSFREDLEIPTGSATLADYRNSGYDRGHLAPAADLAFSQKTMSESFFMSNMSPQLPSFNRGIWKDLESLVRSIAISEGDIYVVTGPILPKTKDNNITIGPNEVTVPEYYYKVVYDRTPPEKMIGFILPNSDATKSLKDYAVMVDAVEASTGLDFFSLVPQPQQEQLESTLTVNAWKW